MIPFEKWIDRLRRLMIYYEYIKPDTVLAAEEFRPLYEQGMKPLDALDIDMDFKHPRPTWSKVALGLPKSASMQEVHEKIDEINRVSIPLKNHEGHATFIGEPSQELFADTGSVGLHEITDTHKGEYEKGSDESKVIRDAWFDFTPGICEHTKDSYDYSCYLKIKEGVFFKYNAIK